MTSNYLPLLLGSVTDNNATPDDSSVTTLPTGQVDYLSHQWREEDVWSSWKSMTRQKNAIANGSRLENASWRTWWKQRNKLKTISPETLNWYALPPSSSLDPVVDHPSFSHFPTGSRTRTSLGYTDHYTQVLIGNPSPKLPLQHSPRWPRPRLLVRIRSLFSSIGASQKFSVSPLPRNLIPTRRSRTNFKHHMSCNHHQTPPCFPAAHSSPTLKAIPTSSEHAPPEMRSARSHLLAYYQRSLPSAVYQSTSLLPQAQQQVANRTS